MSKGSSRRWPILIWSGLHITCGLFFVLMGLWAIGASLGIASQPEQPTRAAADFTAALTNSGFMDPLLGASFIMGGAALLLRRTAPLGLVMLAPSITVILFFHLFLSGQYLWGPFVATYFLALVWHHRRRFAPLWQAQDSGEDR